MNEKSSTYFDVIKRQAKQGDRTLKLDITQKPENGFLGGPKSKCFSVCHNDIEYEIAVNQHGERRITITSSEGISIENILGLYYSLETFLMLLDGQFYPIVNVFENDVETTHSWEKRTLPSHHSADFMVSTGNALLDFEAILDAQLFQDWSSLRDELDLIHKMVLYCLSSVKMPKDMQCAFMTEAFEGLSELIHERKPEIVLPKVNKSESKLKRCLSTIILRFGSQIFGREMQCNPEAFIQLLVDSRNRIAHIKSKQDRDYLNGDESVIYLMKLSLLYRVVLFDFLGIPEVLYRDKLSLRIRSIDNHEVAQAFLKKLAGCNG